MFSMNTSNVFYMYDRMNMDVDWQAYSCGAFLMILIVLIKLERFKLSFINGWASEATEVKRFWLWETSWFNL